jgi:hypothetical protein
MGGGRECGWWLAVSGWWEESARGSALPLRGDVLGEMKLLPGFPGGPGFEAGPPEFLLPSIRVRTGVRWIA